MKISLFPDLKNAISGVCSKLGIKIDSELQQEYQNGLHPKLLSYKKVEKSSIKIPTIQKYLIGAQTILNQPCQFYDINRACRCFFFIQILNSAIETNIQNVTNYEERLDKLLNETDHDPFDAILYEIAVSAEYSISSGVQNVRFLDSKSKTAPEFEFSYNNKKIYVECKKFNRNSDIASIVRNEVRSKAQLTLHAFKKMNQSALLEVAFHKDPKEVPEQLIFEICHEALKKRTIINHEFLSVLAKPLPSQKLQDYTLFPSPMYFWDRYKYRNHGEWFGLTTLIEAKFGDMADLPENTIPLASTWLDHANFECIMKWKITDEDILWRYRKLGYKLLFKGLEQLQSHGVNSILHAWYERDGFAGHRQNELLDFFSRIDKSKKDIFSWIIFNETILDTSIKGVFDLIEHAHPISGFTANSCVPIVSSVFTGSEGAVAEDGAFGSGALLPDIDEII